MAFANPERSIRPGIYSTDACWVAGLTVASSTPRVCRSASSMVTTQEAQCMPWMSSCIVAQLASRKRLGRLDGHTADGITNDSLRLRRCCFSHAILLVFEEVVWNKHCLGKVLMSVLLFSFHSLV